MKLHKITIKYIYIYDECILIYFLFLIQFHFMDQKQRKVLKIMYNKIYYKK